MQRSNKNGLEPCYDPETIMQARYGRQTMASTRRIMRRYPVKDFKKIAQEISDFISSRGNQHDWFDPFRVAERAFAETGTLSTYFNLMIAFAFWQLANDPDPELSRAMYAETTKPLQQQVFDFVKRFFYTPPPIKTTPRPDLVPHKLEAFVKACQEVQREKNERGYLDPQTNVESYLDDRDPQDKPACIDGAAQKFSAVFAFLDEDIELNPLPVNDQIYNLLKGFVAQYLIECKGATLISLVAGEHDLELLVNDSAKSTIKNKIIAGMGGMYDDVTNIGLIGVDELAKIDEYFSVLGSVRFGLEIDMCGTPVEKTQQLIRDAQNALDKAAVAKGHFPEILQMLDRAKTHRDEIVRIFARNIPKDRYYFNGPLVHEQAARMGTVGLFPHLLFCYMSQKDQRPPYVKGLIPILRVGDEEAREAYEQQNESENHSYPSLDLD